MVALIISQLILIGVFRLWPLQKQEKEPVVYFEKEALIVEEMLPTRQPNVPAAPPKPQVPIPVPSDKYIEEEITFPEIDFFLVPDSLSLALTRGQTGDEERISGNPDRPPRIIRIVEPTLSSEAKNSGIKAQVYVTFTVNHKGEVIDAIISEIRLYEGASYKVVNTLIMEFWKQ